MEFFEKLIANSTTIAEALTRIAASLDVIQINVQYFAETAIEERDERLALAHGGKEEAAGRTRATKAELEAKRAMAREALEATGLVLGNVEKKLNKYIDKWDMKTCQRVLDMAADAAAKADAEAAQAADEAAVEAEATAAGGGRVAAETRAAKPSLAEAEKLADAYVRTYTDHVHGAAELSAALKSKYGVDHLDGFTETGLQGVIGFIRGLLSAKAGDPAKAVAAAEQATSAKELTPDEIKALREQVRAACAERAKIDGEPTAALAILRDIGGAKVLADVDPSKLQPMLDALTKQAA